MTGMYGDTAMELMKELARNPGKLPPFQEHQFRQVIDEIKMLFDDNWREASASRAEDWSGKDYLPSLHLRHAALQRNKQCTLAYLYNRVKVIKDMRWEHGPVLPKEVRDNMTEQEGEFFGNYNKLLADFMGSLSEGHGLDLTQDLNPPKSLMVEIRVLEDYGEFELEDGTTVLLNKNAIHFLPMNQVEGLVHQKVVEVIKKPK